VAGCSYRENSTAAEPHNRPKFKANVEGAQLWNRTQRCTVTRTDARPHVRRWIVEFGISATSSDALKQIVGQDFVSGQFDPRFFIAPIAVYLRCLEGPLIRIDVIHVGSFVV